MDNEDFMFDLDIEDNKAFTEEKEVAPIFSELSEGTIIPRKGNFLGLNISQNSSGICLYKDGEKFLYNSNLTFDATNPHAEATLRRQLKEDLCEVIGSTILDLIVIEDVYEGNNPEVTRKLYALNTAIDDLILDGKVICKDFVRVQNGAWKSWLSVVDYNGVYKGFKDKEKIQGYLNLIGISDSGKGFQDRLDATGMLCGYFLKGKEVQKEKKERKLRVSFKDISFGYEQDDELVILQSSCDSEGSNIVYIKDTKISKKKIIDYISSDIFVTSEPIRLGLLADTLGLELIEGGGYLGFWLSEKNKRKYNRKVGD